MRNYFIISLSSKSTADSIVNNLRTNFGTIDRKFFAKEERGFQEEVFHEIYVEFSGIIHVHVFIEMGRYIAKIHPLI